MPYEIEKLGAEHFLLKMNNQIAFDHLVSRVKDDFGYSFTQGLRLHKPTTENGQYLIEFSGVTKENLLSHLAMVTFP
ncbi:hypothetical protein I7H67_03050 [Acinetobacter sp. ACIN00229]|uniref:hypothetical protein n=1 Tax=Acinetobacter sp. ACIN00229 TaxID=2792607 RepID=UPI0018DF5B73|nr:hypothetical protein [Acinetobacter sp. ACIN00229]MBI0421784.1 hypothetical protein [Acinetobacter sp. ACIN00229]